MTFEQIKTQMRAFNSKHGITRKVDDTKNNKGELIEMVGIVVVSNKVLNREYPIEQRTYRFNNYNKALTPNDLGYSIFAICDFDGDVMRIEQFENDDFDSVEILKVVE